MFRFTIRELVLLTLVVALGVGWWLDHRGLEQQIDSIRSENKISQSQLENWFREETRQAIQGR